MKYLFLDFDGVLHGKEFNMAPFCHSQLFCEMLYPYKHLFKIIISSSWRAEYNLEQLCEFSRLHILKDNMIDITPIEADFFDQYGRYKEIHSFCNKNNILMHQWLAIDDVSELFPSDCTQLILTNYATGITHENLHEIILWLNKN